MSNSKEESIFKLFSKKQAKLISKGIQERFKSKTPRPRENHYLKVTDDLTGYSIPIPFKNKKIMKDIYKGIKNGSDIPPKMEMVSRPIIKEGEFLL